MNLSVHERIDADEQRAEADTVLNGVLDSDVKGSVLTEVGGRQA